MLKHIIKKEIVERIDKTADKSIFTEDVIDSYIVSKAFYDRFFFVHHYLNDNSYIIEWLKKESPKYFEELRWALDRGEDINLIIPRWHSKTTGILIWILHSILYQTTTGILYISKESLGKKWIWRIRWELETNKKILADFWNLVPKNSDDKKDKNLKKRQQNFLEFLNGCWLQTLAFGQSPRWQRPTKVIIDDPQDNKDVRNRDVVERFNQWIFTSLYNTLLPWWSMCVVGTIVWEMCLVKFLRDERKRHTIEREACTEDFENVLRPEMRPKEALIKRKEQIGSANFNQEFRNIALQRWNSLIKDEWIKIYTEEELPLHFEFIVIGIDPAQSEKEQADYTWYCVLGKKDNKAYILKSGQIRLSPMKNEEFVYNLYLQYKPQYNCRYFLRKEDNIEIGMWQHLKDRGCALESVRATSDKYTRLLEQAPKIEMWNVYFGNDDKELIYQLTHFPDVEHDDIMDAFVWAIWEKKKTGFWRCGR